jgi:hypothetical protein
LPGEAIAAIYRAIVPGLKRNLALFSAGSAYGVEHLALRAPVVFTRAAAGFASSGLVCEPFFLKEILLGRRKYEFLTAICTYQSFVLMAH